MKTARKSRRPRALILVDLQNDFLPGGALAVPDGDAVIPVANKLQKSGAFDLIVATQDWHPRDHGSFAANHRGKTPGEIVNLNGLRQVLWPVHCVQNTRGAEFHPELLDDPRIQIISKGTGDEDSYSAFDGTALAERLRREGVTEVWVGGLATDYCVKNTVLDALRAGFRVRALRDAMRAVNLQPGDDTRAIAEMRAAGAEVV